MAIQAFIKHFEQLSYNQKRDKLIHILEFFGQLNPFFTQIAEKLQKVKIEEAILSRLYTDMLTFSQNINDEAVTKSMKQYMAIQDKIKKIQAKEKEQDKKLDDTFNFDV